MTTWTPDELRKIGTAEELEIASRRRDGTLRSPVTIWVVRVGEELYVRSTNGRGAAWFRGTQTQGEGRIRAGGVEKEVSFAEETEPAANAQVDAAYRSKYRRYASIAEHMASEGPRAATIKLVPR